MAVEQWKDIPGYPGYEASTLSRIRNARLGNRLVVGTVTRKGFRQVSLRGSRSRKTAFVHRLVFAAFSYLSLSHLLSFIETKTS